MFDFKERIAIVTGASSGIGECTARALANKGARVVLAARRKEILLTMEKNIPNSLAIDCDVTMKESVENLVSKTLEKFGRIDILINNAGILLNKPMMETSWDEIKRLMDTNFFGQVLCARSVLPVMKMQGAGAIVNVASIAGRVGFPNIGYYSASKFALVGFSETLRQEVVHDGIFVSLICPGLVYTPMTKAHIDDAVSKGKKVFPISPETVAEKILFAIEKRKSELIIPWSSAFLYFLHFLFPSFSEWLAWKFRPGNPETLN